MYTTSPCSVPSGTTVVPAPLITAAEAAATTAVANGITSMPQIMQIVAQAVNQMIQKSGTTGMSAFGTPQPIDPNAAGTAMQAGYGAALQALQNNQVGNANATWQRILQRQPGDFAGMRIPASEFNVPQLDPALFSAPASASVQPPSCTIPSASAAPNQIPIQGGFGYQPAKAQLTVRPQARIGILQPDTGLPSGSNPSPAGGGFSTQGYPPTSTLSNPNNLPVFNTNLPGPASPAAPAPSNGRYTYIPNIYDQTQTVPLPGAVPGCLDNLTGNYVSLSSCAVPGMSGFRRRGRW